MTSMIPQTKHEYSNENNFEIKYFVGENGSLLEHLDPLQHFLG